LVLATPSLREIWQALREGADLFISRSSISLFAAGNAFIVGMLGGTSAAAYYFAGEKVVKAGSALLGPLSQALYPRMVRLHRESEAQLLDLARRAMVVMAGAGLFGTIIISLGAPLISDVLFGAAYRPSVVVLRVLAPWIFINGITNVWGIQIMMPLQLDRSLSAIFLASGIANILLAGALVPRWQEVGMAASVLTSCLMVTVAMPIVLWRRGIDPFRLKRRSGA
jgi:PST family polysaccharide transporter/O-antigen flippase